MTSIANRPLAVRSGGNETCCLTVIAKNNLEEVRVSLATYKGARFLDLRTYADCGDGERKPTRKGITLAFRHIDNLIAALLQAKDEAARLGLLPDDRGTDDAGDAR